MSYVLQVKENVPGTPEADMESMHYEDFEVGQPLAETTARAVTDDDIALFAQLSGDRNPLHLSEEYAAQTVFGGRIAHGILGLAVASGLLSQSRLTAGSLIAFLGLEWSFRQPLYPGDAVRVRVAVAEKRPTRDPSRGVVRLRLELLNERDAIVQEGTFALLVRRRAAES